jgi:membrane associated rhomboid family serine protease
MGRDDVTPTISRVLKSGTPVVAQENSGPSDAEYAAAVAQEHARVADYLKRLQSMRPWGPWALFAVCFVMFAWASAAGGTEYDVVLLRFGAIYPPYVFERGQWWRLISATFMHIGFIHFAVNMTCLLLVAPLLERVLGTPAFLALYAVSGLCGSLATTYYNYQRPVLPAGASGALFGVFGAVVLIGWRYRGDIPARVRTQLSSGMIPCILYSLWISQWYGLDNAAHLGGLVGGVLAAALLTKAAVIPLLRRRWAVMLLLIIGLAPFAVEGYAAGRAYVRAGLSRSPMVAYRDPQNRFTLNHSVGLQPHIEDGKLVLLSFSAEYSLDYRAGKKAEDPDALIGKLRQKRFAVERRETRTIGNRKWLLVWADNPEGAACRFAMTSDGQRTILFQMRLLQDNLMDSARHFDQILESIHLLPGSN